MKIQIKLFLLMICLCASWQSVVAQGTKSFSKQMNELKRSGDFLYAEASAESESAATAACNELLKIEITKHLSAEGNEQRIIRDLSDYKCEYLVQPRGEITRVFGFIAKASITVPAPAADGGNAVKHAVKAPPLPPGVNTATQEAPLAESEETQSQPAPASPQNAKGASANGSGLSFNTGDMRLAKWPEEMLRSAAEASTKSKMELKKRLNAYKAQNKIKRLGDNTNSGSRMSDSYIVYFNDEGKPEAFVAPSASSERHDFLTGTTINSGALSVNNYIWFQISK